MSAVDTSNEMVGRVDRAIHKIPGYASPGSVVIVAGALPHTKLYIGWVRMN